ncbi:MAG: choline-sulfatase [Gammaproteobacteria bacterium]|nr:choline-sulfatase [Pseudomonadota bacterium]MBT7813215.1 choline-sulfatase [Pseudomonadota bacterium]MBT7880199.1 choline-sulfatase [Gammaproteobacteria bacterium]
MKKPNILLVMADQMAAPATPWHGNSIVKMPHLSGLAETGVVFDSAYCNSPLCAPARYVMMAGRLPTRMGALDNASEFSAEIPTFAHYLRDSDYRTVLSGKMHFCGPDQLHGFEQRLTTDIYPADFTWTPNWRDPEQKLHWFHNMDDVLQAGQCFRSNQLDYDDEVIFNARRFLFDHARGNDERPFCLVASMIHPHDPYITLPKYWDLYEGADINLPNVRLNEETEDIHSGRLRRIYGADEVEVSDEQIRRVRRAYYGSMSYVDEQVGALLQALRECGYADNTIVVFTADHGDMLGERGLWYKSSFHEWSARVPLIVHAPAEFSPARVDASVSLVDILPTLATIGNGGEEPEYFTPIEGRSLIPQLSGGVGHDEAIGEYFGEGVSYPMFMIRRGRYKYIGSREYPCQLFDVSADPDEVNDLVGSDTHKDIVEGFRTEMNDRWDAEAWREVAIESQDRRLAIGDILKIGVNTPWDYYPGRDYSREYVRNTVDLWELEGRSRFPRFGS